MRSATVLALAAVLTVALGASVKPEGDSIISPHLVGGDRVKHLERAYTTRLRFKTDESHAKYCAAVRLNHRWFLTAAECLEEWLQKKHKEQLLYPAQLVDESYYNWENFDYFYKDPIIHPEYNNVTKANNIGLFQCLYCRPVPDYNTLPELPGKSEKNETFSGLQAVVSGWIITNQTAMYENENNVTSYNTSTVGPFMCKMAYFFRSVGKEHICASSWGGKRITEGHVGAPLVVPKQTENGSKWKLIGIASSTKPWTTMLPVPTVFINIAPYAEWISDRTGITLPE